MNSLDMLTFIQRNRRPKLLRICFNTQVHETKSQLYLLPLIEPHLYEVLYNTMSFISVYMFILIINFNPYMINSTVLIHIDGRITVGSNFYHDSYSFFSNKTLSSVYIKVAFGVIV